MTKAVFLIHGFLGGNGELDSLIKELNKGGYFVFAPVLKGHAKGQEIPPFSFWIEEIESFFLRYYDKVKQVFVIGYSMGGVLASYLASKYKVDKIVFINPAFKHIYFNTVRKKAFLDLPNVRLRKINIVYAIKEMKKLSDWSLIENWVGKVKSPSLIIKCKSDGIVLKDSFSYLYNNLASKNKILIQYRGRHAFWKSKDFGKICYDILSFLNIEVAQ